MKRLFLGILLLVSLLSISANEDLTAWTADRIWTANPNQPWAQVVITKGKRILAVGDKSLLNGFKGNIKHTQGALMVPGMSDNHTHFMAGVEGLISVKTIGVTSKEEFIKRIRDYAEQLPGEKWITGGIWDETTWGGELPTRHWLDKVTGDHPLFLSRQDGHSAIANSKALTLAGITSETPDPQGGKVVRDENGEPTGLLIDAAMEPIYEVLPIPSAYEEDQLLATGMAHALQNGLTGIHSIPNVLEDKGWREFTAFRRAYDNGQQLIRAVIYVPLKDRAALADLIAREGKGDAWLSWPGVKAMTDGSLGSSSAWFHEPYVHNPDNSGFPIQAPVELEKAISEAHELNLQLAIHAIGDKSNDLLLDIFERVNAKKTRPRIEHAQHMTASAIQRMAELVVIASMQPYHAIDDGRWAESRIGKERLAGTYAFRSAH